MTSCLFSLNGKPLNYFIPMVKKKYTFFSSLFSYITFCALMTVFYFYFYFKLLGFLLWLIRIGKHGLKPWKRGKKHDKDNHCP